MSLTVSQCYIGKRRFQKAVSTWQKTHPSDTFKLTLRPYILNPAAPYPGVDKLPYFNQRFGRAHNEGAQRRIGEVGKAEGIDFDWENGKTGRSIDSHRVILLAQKKSAELADKVEDAIYKGYFEDGKDITSPEFLKEAGVSSGMDADEVEKYLASDRGLKEVEQETSQGRMLGISGVPNFIIDDKYMLSGAQEQEEFLDIFERISST